ncbi:MAG: nuclear transport factor 2 family protein [Candidatus Cloacimonetes bacterium]|nr:nuclear transport factor 2 family protein [Candidatus Cloacimonadota bacterium]
MMKILSRNALIIFIVLIFIFCCQQKQQNITERDNEMIKNEVKNKFEKLISALNNLDSHEWSEIYSKDEFISAFVSTDFYSSRKAFINAITSYFTMREQQKVEPLEVEVTALTPTLALLTSQEKTEMLLKNGENMRSKHVFTMIWKKEAEDWKIIHSHESWNIE